MTFKKFSRSGATIEAVERRILFATVWGDAAKLVNQDDAARIYSGITGEGVSVAVIDTGINYNVPALGGGFGAGHKVVAGWDFVDNDSNPVDTDGHGTEVAGVIAADPFEYAGKHYQGVAPDANLVALRVSHGEDGATDANIKKALDWVLANYAKYKIQVVNISMGSGNHSSDYTNSTLSAIFASLAARNILVIAASGNSGDSLFGSAGIAYPAADANVVSVGSVTASDNISTFTQRASILDLLAPGENVISVSETGAYSAVSGTSFSSPYIAGAVALVREANPSLTNAEVLSILRASGKTNNDGDTESGRTTDLNFPRLDILYALKLTALRRGSASNTVGGNAVASDIAYDDQGVLHLAYYDKTSHTIQYATRNPAGLWSRKQVIDTSGADVGSYLSIEIDDTDKPSIAYYDATNGDLKYAHFIGSRWDVSTLDKTGTVGEFASLAFDSEGDPVIAYYRRTGGDLRLMTIDANGAWTRIDVDKTGNVGQWADVSIADAGVLAIGYADATNGDLKYARYLNGQWTIFTVDNLSGVAYIDLNLHNNQAFISYQDTKNGDQKFAKREDSKWFTETVFTPGTVGQYSNLIFDASGTAHIVFYSKSKNWVYQAQGSFGSWTVKKIGDGGAYLSATTTVNEDILSFVSLDPNRTSLQFGLVDTV
ncbi:MAG: S8 family peptidase [Tepidisphaeraceae bacterium]